MADTAKAGVLGAIERMLRDRVSKYRRWSAKAHPKGGLHITQECANERALYLMAEFEKHRRLVSQTIEFLRLHLRCCCEVKLTHVNKCRRCQLIEALEET